VPVITILRFCESRSVLHSLQRPRDASGPAEQHRVVGKDPPASARHSGPNPARVGSQIESITLTGAGINKVAGLLTLSIPPQETGQNVECTAYARENSFSRSSSSQFWRITNYTRVP